MTWRRLGRRATLGIATGIAAFAATTALALTRNGDAGPQRPSALDARAPPSCPRSRTPRARGCADPRGLGARTRPDAYDRRADRRHHLPGRRAGPFPHSRALDDLRARSRATSTGGCRHRTALPGRGDSTGRIHRRSRMLHVAAHAHGRRDHPHRVADRPDVHARRLLRHLGAARSAVARSVQHAGRSPRSSTGDSLPATPAGFRSSPTPRSSSTSANRSLRPSGSRSRRGCERMPRTAFLIALALAVLLLAVGGWTVRAFARRPGRARTRTI